MYPNGYLKTKKTKNYKIKDLKIGIGIEKKQRSKSEDGGIIL